MEEKKLTPAEEGERAALEDIATKEEFMAYEKVRKSGETNMFDLPTVCHLSGLNRSRVLAVMNHYSALKKAYLPEEEK